MPSLAQSREPFCLDERNHVMIPPVLRERRRVINWLEDDQDEEGVKQLAGEYRVTPLLESLEPN